MKIAPFAIASFASFMLGGKVFNTIKDIVVFQSNTDKTGEEKKAEAIAGFKRVGGDLAGWLLNLGIELAVAWLKSRNPA